MRSAHQGVPLYNPRSLSTRHSPPPTLGLFISQWHIAAMPIEPSPSAVFFFRKVFATRLTRPASPHRARIGGHRFQHFDLDLCHGDFLSSRER
jgi:hypothetical protein